MIDGIYNVTVKTPIGVNRGSLKLETTADGESVKASLNLRYHVAGYSAIVYISSYLSLSNRRYK